MRRYTEAMPDPIAYFSGEFIPRHAAGFAVDDAGIVNGAVVTDRVRTYGGQAFALHEHLDRFCDALQCLEIALPEQDTLEPLVEEVLSRNGCSQNRDLAAVLVATPGRPGTRGTLCIHCVDQPRPEWAEGYQNGWMLVVSDIEAISSRSLPRNLKHRSRLHWYRAFQSMGEVRSPAEPLLLDADGIVTESAYGNVLLVQEDRLVAVPRDRALQGVTEQAVLQIASDLGIHVEFSGFSVPDLMAATEVLLTSTGYTIAPVTQIGHNTVGSGKPGLLWSKLAEGFSQRVSFDFVGVSTDALK